MRLLGIIGSAGMVFWALSMLQPGGAAAEVYKWQDAAGTIHYSNKAPSKNMKPVELPPITRGEVKLTQSRLVTCDKHGGVNCQLGPDTDGSVICYDGFRGASARYRFTCTAPKLEVTEISDPNQDGSFSVFIRNSKSVEARDTAVLFRQDGGQEVKLGGPSSIAAFGLAEFVYQPGTLGRVFEKPNLAQLALACSNCP